MQHIWLFSFSNFLRGNTCVDTVWTRIACYHSPSAHYGSICHVHTLADGNVPANPRIIAYDDWGAGKTLFPYQFPSFGHMIRTATIDKTG